MADVGYAALITAFVVAVYAAVAAFVGSRGRIGELWLSARNGVYVVFGLTSIASGALVYSFIAHDFSIRYVAEHSSTDLPLTYTFAGWWAGQEGSLLFWAWVLSLLAVIVVVQGEKRRGEETPLVAAVLMGILGYILGVIAFAANPLEKMPLALTEGAGLNPLLRTSDMISHPTTLLLGYTMFAVPFAFAMAALISGRLDDWWIRSTRRWTLVAWLFLSLGNLFGMLWAYRVLGWGGYWAWDPVENAAFMPWLTGTAFLHSVMIQQRRGMLKVWNMGLIIITFSLCVFGTMVTRSGILSSVHAFAMGAVGPLLLAFLAVVLVGSLGLLWMRLGGLRSEHRLDSMVSREASFLANNLLLVGAAFAVFWGTIFPLVSEAVRGVKVAVGPPFYEQVAGPIFLGLIVLIGVCSLIGWRKASVENLMRNFLMPVVAAAVVGVVLYLLGLRPVLAVLAFAALVFVAATIVVEFYRGVRARHRHGDGYLIAVPRLVWRHRPRYGGYIVHLGVILLAMGIIGSQMFSASAEATLAPGESMEIRGYTLTFKGLEESNSAAATKTTGRLEVARGGSPIGSIESSKRVEGGGGGETVTDAGIWSKPEEDLYVILGSWAEDGSEATFKVFVHPLIMWIWVGGGVLVGGTLIAFWPDAREGRRAPVRRWLRVGEVETSRA